MKSFALHLFLSFLPNLSIVKIKLFLFYIIGKKKNGKKWKSYHTFSNKSTSSSHKFGNLVNLIISGKHCKFCIKFHIHGKPRCLPFYIYFWEKILHREHGWAPSQMCQNETFSKNLPRFSTKWQINKVSNLFVSCEFMIDEYLRVILQYYRLCGQVLVGN